MKKLIFVIMLFSVTFMGCAKSDNLDSDNGSLEEVGPANDEPGSDKLTDDEAEKLRKSFIEVNYSEEQAREIMNLFSNIDPNKVVPENLLKKVILFYYTNNDRIPNKDYVTIIDFSARSSEDRLFLVDMKTGEVETHQVAHGKGSDRDDDGYATRFKNERGSNASSIGYYMTAETYYGGHGRSLRIDGISSTNSAARRRSVVIHGADYVRNDGSKPGRSFGCPALSMKVKEHYIDRTKEGSLIYAGLSKTN